ncbi:MAG: hypothetical protein BroJett015_06280 [Chloroflexota bacterium]|nr:MAG: hypothetical protein BroJett015_06280 [Chloroflexota bacterium]
MQTGVQPSDLFFLGDKDGSLEIHLQMKRDVAEKLTQYIQGNDSIEIVQTDLTPENIQELENSFFAQYFLETEGSQAQKGYTINHSRLSKTIEVDNTFTQVSPSVSTSSIRTPEISIDEELLREELTQLANYMATPDITHDEELLRTLQVGWREFVARRKQSSISAPPSEMQGINAGPSPTPSPTSRPEIHGYNPGYELDENQENFTTTNKQTNQDDRSIWH